MQSQVLKGGTGHQIVGLTAPGSAQQHHSQLPVLRQTRFLMKPSLLTLSHSSRTVDSQGARITALTMGTVGFRCAMEAEHASTGRVATRTSATGDAMQTSVAAPHRQARHRAFAPHQPVPLLPQHLAATMLKKPNRTVPKHTSRSSITQNVRSSKSEVPAHAVPSSLAVPKHALVSAVTTARIQRPTKPQQVKKRRLHRDVPITKSEVSAHKVPSSLTVPKHVLVSAATRARIQSHTNDG